MEQEIGPRLRELRQRHRLSQRQLARQSGVANATISQIESGKLNPTVSMLKKILDGVPMSLGEFFSDDLQPRDRLFFRADEADFVSILVGHQFDDLGIKALIDRYDHTQIHTCCDHIGNSNFHQAGEFRH